MEAHKPSFMLLPNFSFLADDKNVKLGHVLPSCQDSAMPDPCWPFKVCVDATDSTKQEYEPWSWVSDKSFDVGGGVWADLAVLQGIDAGTDSGHSRAKSLHIDCQRVVQQTFYPTRDDIDKILADSTVAMVLKKLKRPSVYLITGIMVAYGADIKRVSSTKQDLAAHAGAAIPNTPVSVGVKGNIGTSNSTNLSHVPKKPFILAYQLHRIRRGLTKSVKQGTASDWALFSDEVPLPDSSRALSADIELDVVTEELLNEANNE